jgi:predicted DNA-binding antitoxin AbrB/MazE fold protein
MSQSIRAIYENGVFRPLEILDLSDHQQVVITVESESNQTDSTSSNETVDPLSGIRTSTGISDLAENFDEYRFGKQRP